jgi:hypothetical protein
MLVHHLLLHVFLVLQLAAPAPTPIPTPAPSPGVVPNPAPVSPVDGGDVTLLLSYAKWGSLMACGASALIAGGSMAIGQHSNRPEMADKGKRALLWSLGGGVVTGLAIPVLNTIINSVH